MQKPTNVEVVTPSKYVQNMAAVNCLTQKHSIICCIASFLFIIRLVKSAKFKEIDFFFFLNPLWFHPVESAVCASSPVH